MEPKTRGKDKRTRKQNIASQTNLKQIPSVMEGRPSRVMRVYARRHVLAWWVDLSPLERARALERAYLGAE